MIRFPIVFLIVLALLTMATDLRAQSETETVCWIVTGPEKPAKWVLVAVTPDQKITLRSLAEASMASDRKAELSMPFSRVKSVTIEPPPTWDPFLTSLATEPSLGKISTVAALAKRYVTLADLPGSNGAVLAFAGSDALSAAGANKECLEVLEALFRQCRRDEDKIHANLRRAQILASEGKAAEAEALLLEIPMTKRNDPYFTMDRMARGRIAFIRKDYRTAIDFYAQAFIRATPADPWVPESMYFIATCYLEVGRDSDPTKEESKFEEVGGTVFSDLVAFYPESSWARKAKNERGITPRVIFDKPEASPNAAAAAEKPPKKPAQQETSSPSREEKEIR